jgi:DNA-binding transcriptional MocR family regulator
LQVAQAIVSDIQLNAREAGDRLPQEEDMLARYEVARATLREALRFLELQGVIQSATGSRRRASCVAAADARFCELSVADPAIHGYRSAGPARTARSNRARYGGEGGGAGDHRRSRRA